MLLGNRQPLKYARWLVDSRDSITRKKNRSERAVDVMVAQAKEKLHSFGNQS